MTLVPVESGLVKPKTDTGHVTRHDSSVSSISDFDQPKSRFQEFIQGTTFHGIRFIFNPSGSILRRQVTITYFKIIRDSDDW